MLNLRYQPTPSEVGHRLEAIRRWCEHAASGRCSENEAVAAIAALTDACRRIEAA